MIQKVYKGNSYIDNIFNGLASIKYNEKKNIGSHLKMLTKSGVYDLDYDLNMIDCEFNKGLEHDILYMCNSSDNHTYIMSRENVVRKLTSNLEEVTLYRSDIKITLMIIDDKDNIYLCGSSYIVKLNSNLEFIKSEYYNEVNHLVYIGDDKILLATNVGVLHIIDTNTLLSTKSCTSPGYINDIVVDYDNGFYYIYNYYKLAKFNKELELISINNDIKVQGIYIKDRDTIYAMDYGSMPPIIKLNGNLEVIASCNESFADRDFVVKDNLIMYYGYDGVIKLNDNLELVDKMEINYPDAIIVNENLDIYVCNYGTIYKYNKNYEKLKEIQCDANINDMCILNKKIYILSDDKVIIYNDNFELIKTIKNIQCSSNIYNHMGNVYFASYEYDLYKIDYELDELMSFEKIGRGFSDLLFNGIIYTLNNDYKIRRFNNKLEEVNSIDLSTYNVNSFIITDNIYLKVGSNKIYKLDKSLSKIDIYTHSKTIDEMRNMKDSNNIFIINDDLTVDIINSKFEKIASYEYSFESYPEYYINDYIYCINDTTIIKLDKSFNVIATYNTGSTEFSLNKTKVLFLNDESIIISYNYIELIKLNSNLEETNRYVSSEKISKLYHLEDNNIAIYNEKSTILKLNNNLEEVSSNNCSRLNNIYVLNGFYYIISPDLIFKTNYNLEDIKAKGIQGINESYMFHDNIYIDYNYSLIKYDENLDKVSSINGINIEKLISV